MGFLYENGTDAISRGDRGRELGLLDGEVHEVRVHWSIYARSREKISNNGRVNKRLRRLSPVRPKDA